MSTQVKRLLQNGVEFVPITLAEAVVVNGSNIPGFQSVGITTLDKVLRTTLGIVGTNASDIQNLQNTVEQINTELESKQDKLTAGVGIVISDTGVISTTLKGFQYKIVTQLPDPNADAENIIFLTPSPTPGARNVLAEFICIYKDDKYVWEQLGTLAAEVDLSGYLTKEEFNNYKAISITAIDVTTSNGNAVTINWEIPSTLYDS